MKSHRLFGLAEGRALRDEGLARVAASNARWIEKIRMVARSICSREGSVTSDDLRRWADRHDCHPHHQNAWGAVFRGKEWVATGFTQSAYKSNHARRITVWTLAHLVDG